MLELLLDVLAATEDAGMQCLSTERPVQWSNVLYDREDAPQHLSSLHSVPPYCEICIPECTSKHAHTHGRAVSISRSSEIVLLVCMVYIN
jgi:hypothetical protein